VINPFVYQNYYQQQLENLRELAAEFAHAHPSIAPLLSKTSTDPDVERLLEGVAFLCGLIQQRIDDEFPEIIHALIDILFPHYLRPIPSVSIVKFTPRPGLMETLRIEAGSMIAAKPIEGTECLFRTCYDTEIYPLELIDAAHLKPAAGPHRIRLSFKLKGIKLSQWNPTNVRFFLGENLTQGTDLLVLLDKYLQNVTFTSHDEGSSVSLPPAVLKPLGFEPEDSLLPYPQQSFGGFSLLQEYFLFPQKHLFMDLTGWENWKDRGDDYEFDVIFELKPCNVPIPKISTDQFHLFTAPVINLFQHDAEPIVRDHRAEKMLINPSIAHPEHYRVFSIENVVGIERGTVKRKEYQPIGLFVPNRTDEAIYQLIHSVSVVNNSPELYITFPYTNRQDKFSQETFSITLLATNGKLPEQLRPGDINRRTEGLPELVEVVNIMTPTSSLDPPIGKDTLWKFLSHLSLNFSRIAEINNFKTLLELYVFPESREREKITINKKRIEGLSDISLQPVDRLYGGTVLRGQKVIIRANLDHFAGWGDLYLFGSVIDRFLCSVSSINTFIELELYEELSGESLKWPPRSGNRLLI
jgi:type VI secretion system protein ImpG